MNKKGIQKSSDNKKYKYFKLEEVLDSTISDKEYMVENKLGEYCGDIIFDSMDNCFKFNWLDIGDVDEEKMLELANILKDLNQTIGGKDE